MIPPIADAPHPRHRARWRRALPALVLMLPVTACGTAPPPVPPVPSPTPSPTPAVDQQVIAPSPSPSPSPSPPGPDTLLRLPGEGPAKGSGTFGYAAGGGPVLGSGGPVRRFRIAVENGSGEDVTAFAATVVETLGDARSWVGDGSVRLQPVSGAERADFTVYLVTRETAYSMCLAGGTDIRVNGVPYTSCRATGKVIVNADRWRRSANPYLSNQVPLAVYRRYVVNHEVGHELGHRHQTCPRPGRPAPVMVQQTLTLRGCTPFAWPVVDGKRYAGPPL